MELLELLAWAVVELQSPSPKTKEVARALELALASAAALDLNHQVRTKNLIRLAQVAGVDGLNGGAKWNI